MQKFLDWMQELRERLWEMVSSGVLTGRFDLAPVTVRAL